MNSHGGARKGAGRKASPDNQKLRVERLQEQLREKVESALVLLGENAEDIMVNMIDAALRVGNKDVTCSQCGHVTEVVMPMADAKMQQWLMGKLFQTQDIEDDTNLDAARRIVNAIKGENGPVDERGGGNS